MQRRIAGFHQDEIGDWVADLECGHGSTCATTRPGASALGDGLPHAMRIGTLLECRKCDEEE